MTVSSVDLSAIQQTLSEMQSAAQVAASSSDVDGGPSFASSLAQATAVLSGDDGLSDTDTENPVGDDASALSLAGTGSGEDDLELMALLLSGQGSTDAGAGIDAGVNASSAEGLSEPSDATGSAVVDEASQFIGTPYVWGGSSPQGFDCSGFTQYVFNQIGVSLPRTAAQQATVGTPVDSLVDAQPGDLIFFAGSDGTASAPGHVGIYVGDGDMIDVPETGSVVHVQPVSSAGPVVAIRNVLASGASSAGTGTMMGNVAVPAQYVSVITQAAAANGIPASLLAALLDHESAFDPNAVSSTGAEGIAQFMPATAAGMGIDPDDPSQAINGAAQLLGSYTAQFGNYADALAAYNAGSSAVKSYGGVPPYAQTQAYVPAVLSLAGLSSAPETAT